jgi:hypothetical protein
MRRDAWTSSPTSAVDEYLHDVDSLLTEDGCKVSSAFDRIRAGWQAACAGMEPDRRPILDAVLAGDAEAVRVAIERFTVASAVSPGTWRDKLARDVMSALRAAYEESAGSNYQTSAERFDAAASKLHECAATVDLATAAESIVGKSSKERQAWMDAGAAARELDELAPRLAAAARLAGVGVDAEGARLALVCDPATTHRRRVWEAWQTCAPRTTRRGKQVDGPTHRLGRWGALVGLEGVTIRAASLDSFQPYAPARPLEVVQVHGALGVHQVAVDPEDADAAEQIARLKHSPATAAKAANDERLKKAWRKHLGQGDTAVTAAEHAKAEVETDEQPKAARTR